MTAPKRCRRCGHTKPADAYRYGHSACRKCESADRSSRKVAAAPPAATGQPVRLPRRDRPVRAEPWMAGKACKGVPTDVFFPGQLDRAGMAEAKAICQRCPVTGECLDYAQREGLHDGVYGGLSATERKRLRLAEKRANLRPDRLLGDQRRRTEPPECGTNAALSWHRRYHPGEPLDDACRRFRNDQRESRRLKAVS